MNFIFISPHFPPNYLNFCLALKKLGVKVLGLGDTPEENLSGNLKAALFDYQYIPNMENYESVLQACAYFIYRYGKIDRIESLNEHWLELEAFLREDLNVYGIRPNKIQAMKQKSLMKQKFRQAGVAVARGHLIPTWEDAMQLIQEVGFPVVVKPDKGVGATRTYKLHNLHELEYFFATRTSNDYIMEEFVQGQIISFDGLVDQDGKLAFYTAHQNCDGVMEIILEDRHTAYFSLREIPLDLLQAGERIIQAFELRERFFHFEFFRLADGRLVVLEVNMRPPGGFTVDMFNYANDIDIYQEWANVVVHNRFLSSYNWKYHCGFIGRKFSKPYVHSHEEILREYGPWIVYHSPISGTFRNAMGDYAYLMRSRSIDVFFEMRAYIHKTH